MPRPFDNAIPGSFIAAAVLAFCCASFVLAERLPIKVYTSADGLGSSASFNLVRDQRGFIWLCSRDGLVRFDGQRFITYRIGDGTADPAVFDLIPTSRNDYWVNLNRGTDYRFVPPSDDLIVGPRGINVEGDMRVPVDVQPVIDMPMPRFEDSEGNLWTADKNGIYLITEVNGKMESQFYTVTLPGNPKPGLSTIDFNPARNGSGFWLGTNWGAVRRFSDGREIHFSIAPNGDDDPVRIFAEDDDTRIWIAKPNGVVVVKTDTESEPSARKTSVKKGVVLPDGSAAMPDVSGDALEFSFADLFRRFSVSEMASSEFGTPIITRIIVAADGKVWISTSHGLILFDGNRFHHYTVANGLASNEIISIVEGSDGDIWLASHGGLHRLNLNGLTTFDESDGIPRTRIHNIFENGSGQLEVVSGNFTLSSFEDGKFQTIRPDIPDGSQFTWQSTAALHDSRDNWWMYTSKNLYRFSGVRSIAEFNGRKPDATYNDSNGLIGGNVTRAFEDSKGDLWFSSYFGAESRGISRLDHETGKFQNFYTGDGLPEIAVATGFTEDAAGNLWAGFVEGGIARFRDGKFSTLEGENVPKAGVTNMFRDSKDRVWIATSREGLVLVENPTADNPSFKRFTIADGLTSNNIRCVTGDNFGNIYVGTVRGVNRLSPESGQVRYYGTADGLATDFVNTMFRDRHGDIWFGTFNGLSRLTPRKDETVASPEILISGLHIAGQDYSVSPLGQRSVLLADQNPDVGNIQIDFLSVRSGGSSSTRYQHKFENSSVEWTEPTSESSVTFANLAAGSYRFMVRAISAEGVVSGSPAVVSFTVLRPIWQRWWFLLLAAIFVASIIYLFYRLRVAQLVKLERIRTRIASDLHDDIGSSLSQIAILSEVARRRSGDNGASEPLKIIADTSREMVDSMSDIVWAINPRKDTLGDLVSRMRRFAEDTLDANDIGYKFNFDDSVSGTSLGTDTRRDAYLIFKESINNILKHAKAGNVDITVDLSGGMVRFRIVDDGIGFSEPEDPHQTFPGFGGNGLINMRRRAEGLGGKFAVNPTSGKGTIVDFSLPLKIIKAVSRAARKG